MIIETQINNFVREERKVGPIKNPNYKGMYKNKTIYTKALFQGYGDAQRVLHGISEIISDNIKLDIFQKASIQMEDYFEGRCTINSQSEYDEWHKKICNTLVKLFHEHGYDEFSFGVAQKIINMSFKYLRCYMVGRAPFDIAMFKYCHCPIDTYVCKNIESNSKITLNNLEKQTLKNVYKGKTPWSKLTLEQYKEIQDVVNKASIIIKEFSDSDWIEFGNELEVSEANLTTNEISNQLLYKETYGISKLDVDILLWKKK